MAPGLRAKVRMLRPAAPLTLCRLALWGFVCLLVTRTLADADLWGHLRFGLDMLETGALHTEDPYSFTSDRPWINHEWLAELLMGLSYTALGGPGLVLLKVGTIAVVALILMIVANQERARPLARDLFVALVIFVTYTRTQVVRPQIFSVALFCVVLYLWRESDRGRPKALWVLPVCFAGWVNLHGGWIVGLAAVGVWLAGDAWKRGERRHTLMLAGIGALSVVATLVNPYGYGLWQFIGETVRLERSDITDWKPLLELPAGILVIEAVLPLVALAALWRTREHREVSLRDGAVLAVLAFAMFRVGRVDAFFQAAVAVLLARPILGLFGELDLRVPPVLQRRSVPVAALAVVLVAYVAGVAFQNLRAVRVEGYWIPDRQAAMFLRETRPGARVLTWFDWGEYAVWQLSPANIKVSMDGRRETVYSQQVLAEHNRFYRGDPEMVDYPDRIGADHVWLPRHFSMIEQLTDRGWTVVCGTEESVVLARDAAAPAYTMKMESGPRVFPWP